MLYLPPAVIEKVPWPISKEAVVNLLQSSNALVLRSRFAFVFDHRMMVGLPLQP